MDQSVKHTRGTSGHKCILIRNPAYKYKHYKFSKYEGLVGAVPVQRLPQELHDRSPFKPAPGDFPRTSSKMINQSASRSMQNFGGPFHVRNVWTTCIILLGLVQKVHL